MDFYRTATWTRIPEGEHIFQIYSIEENPEFGKIALSMVTADGQTHVERFNTLNANGEINEWALSSLTHLLTACGLDGDEGEPCSTDDLLGCYFKGTIEHSEVPKKDDPTKTSTFANLRGKALAPNGFEDPISPKTIKILQRVGLMDYEDDGEGLL